MLLTIPNKEQICLSKLQSMFIHKFILKMKSQVFLGPFRLSESPEGHNDITSWYEIKRNGLYMEYLFPTKV